VSLFTIGEESDSDLDPIPSASGFRRRKEVQPIQTPNVNEKKESVTQKKSDPPSLSTGVMTH
jgi:hypothetical protein